MCWCGRCLVPGLVFVQSLSAATSFTHSATNRWSVRFLWLDGSISITIQGDHFLYGNNVTRSPTYLRSSAQRSFIDTAHPLPFGLLTHFYVFTSPAAGLVTTVDRRIQLQIWRLLSNATKEYRLVWQQPAFVNTSSTGALLTVSNISIFNGHAGGKTSKRKLTRPKIGSQTS